MVKVKVTPVQALRLCTGRTAHRGCRGIALPFHNHGTRRGWGVSVTPRPLFTPVKDSLPTVQEAGWAQDRARQVRKISPPTGIRSPDRPARSQSLYRLNYPAHTHTPLYILTLYRRSADRFIERPSPYRAVNTFHLGHKNQSVYAVSGTSRCLFSDKYKTHKY